MKENKFTQIPNKLLEVLSKVKLSEYQFRYICFLIRKTYGFHRAKDYISNSQFVEGTAIRKQNINRVRKQLLERKIVIRSDYKIGINKNFTEWENSNPQRLPIIRRDSNVISTAQNVISTEAHKIKDQKKIPKETLSLSCLEAYKNGDRRLKPFYGGEEMRWSAGKFWVVPKDGGEWLEFADPKEQFGKIDWK